MSKQFGFVSNTAKAYMFNADGRRSSYGTLRYPMTAIGLMLIVSVGCQPPANPGSNPSSTQTLSTTTQATTTQTNSSTTSAISDDAVAQANIKEAETEAKMGITKSGFGKLEDGTEVDLYTCTNSNGLVLKLTNYGAIVVSLETPDRDGKLANINAGFDSVEEYVSGHPYFGSTVGRYCNRIAKGKFKLNDQEYTLATNNDPNHLHGGDKGFDKQMWDASEVKTDDAVGIKFHRVSKDGEEGYPGNLDVTVVYTLTNSNELKVEFTATTDADTVLNLTNHNYWNLGGFKTGTIKDHVVTIEAGKFLAVDDTLIPTGELTDVEGTPLDFRKPRAIGDRINDIKADPVGYDHCYALNSQDGSLALAATVKDPATGRVMTIKTTQPGIQLYSGNFLAGGDNDGGLKQHEAFCLETQHYPDSPNQDTFPSTVLKPGQTFSQVTVHTFTTE